MIGLVGTVSSRKTRAPFFSSAAIASSFAARLACAPAGRPDIALTNRRIAAICGQAPPAWFARQGAG